MTTIEKYSEIIGYKGKNPTLEEIQNFAENELDWTIWDYPLEEADYCMEEGINVIVVETEFGLRLCEI